MLRKDLNCAFIPVFLFSVRVLMAAADEFLTPPSPPPGVQSDESVAPSASDASITQRRDLPEEAQQFIRGIALLLLPQTFEDEKGWGREKRIQSGLKVDFRDGKIDTRRRCKHVNHGAWLQGSGELVEPENTFRLKAVQLPSPDSAIQRYEVNVSAQLRVQGRQQRWSYGVMLWSISAEATASVSLQLVLDVKSQVVASDRGVCLRLQPNVVKAKVKLDDFRLHRISHAKGTSVQGIGELVEELIESRIGRENKDLASRINKSLQKKPERLEIPLSPGSWFQQAGAAGVSSEVPSDSLSEDAEKVPLEQ